jgi:uncharacterized protein
MFFTVLFSGLALLSGYLGWRAGSVPWIRRHLPWWSRTVLLLALGVSFIAARAAQERGWLRTASVLEFVGAHWLGVLLLLAVALFAADLVTGFGLFFRRRLPAIRASALVGGVALSAIALVQGNRAPVVRDHEVRLTGFSGERGALTILFVSDLHLGTLRGERWLGARVSQINALRPGAILLGGDILEGDSPAEADLLPLLGRLRAPLGVWAVAGNHEYHGGGATTLAAMEKLGFHVLRNQWREVVPGLVLAGVDGARERSAVAGGPAATQASGGRLARALAGRPAGAATILVSHQPLWVENAARAGVGLMLSGHTHDGQIWPFRYLVRTQTPYLAGRYEVNGMPLIVCRGTGTFGPRMRLWYPSEILRITLSPPA